MKNLLLFVLILVGTSLYFRDKQHTEDLLQAQQENASLKQQLTDKETALSALQAKTGQSNLQSATRYVPGTSTDPLSQPAHKSKASGNWMGAQDPDPLNRPAYK